MRLPTLKRAQANLNISSVFRAIAQTQLGKLAPEQARGRFRYVLSEILFSCIRILRKFVGSG